MPERRTILDRRGNQFTAGLDFHNTCRACRNAAAIRYRFIIGHGPQFQIGNRLGRLWKYAANGIAFSYGFYLIFSKYLWRIKLIQWIFNIDRPDLNGRWTGKRAPQTLKGPAESKIIDTEIAIEQTLYEIRFREQNHAKGNKEITSTNFGEAASLSRVQGRWRLSVIYSNRPMPDGAKHGAAHFGALLLELDSMRAQGCELTGEYWTSKRTKIGSLEIQGTTGLMSVVPAKSKAEPEQAAR